MLKKLGGRKFTITAGALLMAFALTVAGKLTGGDFVTIAVAVVGAFHAAHITQDWPTPAPKGE